MLRTIDEGVLIMTDARTQKLAIEELILVEA